MVTRTRPGAAQVHGRWMSGTSGVHVRVTSSVGRSSLSCSAWQVTRCADLLAARRTPAARTHRSPRPASLAPRPPAPPAPPAASPRPAPAGSARGSRPAHGWNRCAPAAGLDQAEPRQALQQRVQRQACRSPATSRDRNSLSTLASKPWSSSSRPSAYFHDTRSRTASAACRSARFSVNCSTLAIISWPGKSPAAPAPRTRRQTAHRHTPRPAPRGSASPDSPSGTTTAPLSQSAREHPARAAAAST